MARAKDIIRNVVGGLSRLISIVTLIAIFVLSFLLIRSIMQTDAAAYRHFADHQRDR